ncbi:MAG: DUF748 domain-containing protein [Panacagrimonas sp.]
MPSKPPSRRRWWKLPLILAGTLAVLVIAYTLAGFFGVPRLVHAIAPDEVAKLGRKLELGEVKFNPFTFEASIAALRLTEADGAPLLAFDSLYVDADVVDSLRQRGFVLQAIRWTAPDIALVVERDGSINLSKLIPTSDEPAEPKPEMPVPSVRIGDLVIENGRIGIEDRSRPEPFSLALSPIEFSLKDFRTELGHGNAYLLKGTATTGEEIEWTGDFTVQPLGSSGQFALRKLQASTLVSYLQTQLPVRLVSGVAELSGDYRLALDPSLSLDVHLPAIRLKELALGEPGNAKAGPPLSVAELNLHELNLSLAKREVALQRVEIKGLRADVKRESDGGLNLARLYAPLPAPPPALKTQIPVASESAPEPWKVAVGGIELAGSEVRAEDRAIKPAVRATLKPITAKLSGFSIAPGSRLKLDASIGLDRKARLSTQGEIVLQPLSAKLALDLQGYDLSVLQPYLAGLTGVTLESGVLAVKGKLSYVEKDKAEPRLDFAGEAGVSNFQVDDRALKQDLLHWRALQVAGIAFSSAPQSLSIGRVNLVEPYARVVIAPDREINIVRAFAAPGTAAKPAAESAPGKAAEPKPSKPMPISVKTVRVENGHVQFADLSIDPQFSAGIFELNGELTNLSSEPSTRSKIRLEGKVDEFAPVLVSGDMIPAEFAKNTEIALSFRNMDLVSFNPYSGRFAGYNIVKGKLTTELKYKIENRELEAEHHVVLDQLEFGDATGSKEAVPLPVKLGVSLLKDRHGVIDLALPVRGNLDDPTFRVAPLVWKVLTNLLTKAVTSPFAALARLIGGGDELAYVDFAPGVAELSAVEAGKLDKLASALIERPQLKLDVPLAQADAMDGQVLAQRELALRVPAEAPEVTPEKAQKNRLRALEALHQELLGTEPAYPADIETLDRAARPLARVQYLEPLLTQKLLPTAGALEQLAAARARAVQAAVLARPEIQPERIFLTARRASSLSEAGDVRMELSLQ